VAQLESGTVMTGVVVGWGLPPVGSTLTMIVLTPLRSGMLAVALPLLSGTNSESVGSIA
jgi:hypothetical protein